MGVPAPSLSRGAPLEEVTETARRKLDREKVDRCLVYAPDAIGENLYLDYRDSFEKVRRFAPIEVSLRSVSPSITPVCFASMFTGAPPGEHGIPVDASHHLSSLQLRSNLWSELGITSF